MGRRYSMPSYGWRVEQVGNQYWKPNPTIALECRSLSQHGLKRQRLTFWLSQCNDLRVNDGL